jgi:ubiquitin carboxyl-terminal hydrolase 34
MCCYRDLKNFDRFNYVIRSLIYLIVNKLKDIKSILSSSTVEVEKSDQKTEKQDEPDESNQKSEVEEEVVVNEKTENEEEKTTTTTTPKEKQEDQWTVAELEKVLIFISKVFLLNFPLYIAHKHGMHYGHESSQQEIQAVSVFCDIHDTEIPVYLYHNVTLFCSSGGFGAMTNCFEIADLPLSLAHACTVAISNIKLWLNYRSIVQLFVPLRIKVLQYMCKLSDQDLRSPATKSMADFMWSAIKDPLDSQLTFDTEGLALAFKYFTSTTLTMRLAGMSQINAHINWFNDICTTETVAEVELVGRKLADWLTENQIISHLFGPNLHVEIIKQSHIVLNFLAVENHITEEHISLIWQASQLKHCSKPIYDILPSLVKNLAPKPASYLYSLLCKLDPKEHSEQSIYIISALTKLIWTRDRNRHAAMSEASSSNIREITEIASSSENSVSVSVDGSNSDEDHRHVEEDSSDECTHHLNKSGSSPIEVDGSDRDSGQPPCKQARNVTTLRKKILPSRGEDGKVQEIYEIKEKKAIYPIIGHRMSSYNNTQASSSEDERIDLNEKIIGDRKKIRRKRKKHLSRKEIQEMVESISDNDSECDPLFGGSDCSEGIHDDVLERLNKDDSFFRAISENCHLMDYLRSTEHDGSSSPMSTKSEKNLADFDDEESPCEELTALAVKPNFCFSRDNRSSTPDNTASSKKTDSSSNEKNKSSSSGASASAAAVRTKSPDQPGNTLLWDLLQDDKIVSKNQQFHRLDFELKVITRSNIFY